MPKPTQGCPSCAANTTHVTLGRKNLRRLAKMEATSDFLAAERADHEARLRSLERFRWLASGTAGLVAAAGYDAIAHLIGR